ncbi:7tm Odorant receptor [Popillia japonica]|uniref:7tm Odorant receptor n=1 Tax=Popillia japonica TaxID=7064 RepID=A0AAW1LRM2_POPJA
MLNLKELNPLVSTRSSNIRTITILQTEELATISIASSLFTNTLESDSVVDNISDIVFSIQKLLLFRSEFIALFNYVDKFWPIYEFGVESIKIIKYNQSYCELEQIEDTLFNLSINGDIRKVGVIWETAVLVRHRGTSLESAQRINKLMGKDMPRPFSATLFSSCTGLYVLTYKGFPPPPTEAAVKLVPFVVCAAFQVFAYGAAGEKNSEQTESIADAAHDCRWWVKCQPG